MYTRQNNEIVRAQSQQKPYPSNVVIIILIILLIAILLLFKNLR